MTVKTGQMRQDKSGTTAVTVLGRENGLVRFTKTEYTPDGAFAGRDRMEQSDFESRYPVLRGPFGEMR